MNQNIDVNLDAEFKKYLQILRPYLGQLIDHNVIDICNAWIKKLSDCKENEKALRNKYVFGLCYQLAKGELEEPFLKPPPPDDLPFLHDVISSDSSFSEVEYIVIDSENGNTKVNCGKVTPSYFYTDSGVNVNKSKQTFCADTNCDFQNTFSKKNIHRTDCASTTPHNTPPYIDDVFTKCNECDENYQFRAKNLIMKLREIKQQNLLLHNELIVLRQETKRNVEDSLDDSLIKIDNTTNTDNNNQENTTILKSLKCKLQEVQQSRNNLIETVGSLQDKLDVLNEIKKHEIEEMEAKYKLEIIKLKTLIREEVKSDYEYKLEELKNQYEKVILEIQCRTKEEIEALFRNKEKMLAEKNKEIQMKDDEISALKRQLDEMKSHQFSILNRFLDSSNDDRNESAKTYELEKRLNKMERTKNKCAKAYEAKVASLQREKHLAECSLQLQLVKQRAQVLNEVTEENQVELATALDKLENKYKEIVANVQATAVQRRVQDQIALGALIQAVCGTLPKEKSYVNPNNINTGQFSGKTIRNQNKDGNRSPDREFGALYNGHKVESVIVENKSIGEDNARTGYCLDSEKLQELFERVHIPQRDVGDVPK